MPKRDLYKEDSMTLEIGTWLIQNMLSMLHDREYDVKQLALHEYMIEIM